MPLSVITLVVSSLKDSEKFYLSLGFKPVDTSAPFLRYFQAGSIRIAILEAHSFSDFLPNARLNSMDSNPLPSGIIISRNVSSSDQVKAWLEIAKNSGARILKPHADAPWGGSHGFFEDLDGYIWEVVWNPSWKNS